MKKLGIIAAKGDLSQKLIEYAKDKFDLFVVAIINETNPALLSGVNHVWIQLGEIGKAIDAMHKAQIKELVFVGSLQKPDIFSLKLDAMGTKLLAKMVKDKFFGDNKLLAVLTNFLEDNGFEVIGVQDILKDLVVEAANFTILLPDDQDRDDIELAIKVVTQLGSLDIGQAAIVQNGVVLGVEAIEGTDNLIKRCSQFKRTDQYGGVLAKFSKPGQELRIDLPTIGIATIKNLHQAGFKGVVIEANKAIFLDRDQAIEYANQNQMFICSL